MLTEPCVLPLITDTLTMQIYAFRNVTLLNYALLRGVVNHTGSIFRQLLFSGGGLLEPTVTLL